MALFVDAFHDTLSSIHDAGRRHALPVVRDEGAGGEAAGVVRAVEATLSCSAAQAAKATRRVWGHAPEVLVDEEMDHGLSVEDGVESMEGQAYHLILACEV